MKKINTLLSILLPTVTERAELFHKLHVHLKVQSFMYPEVELIPYCDNKEISIGLKRQRLLEQAKGKYVVFIDDDDWVSEDYVEQIYNACLGNVDSVGMEIYCTGTKGKTASVSNRWPDWAEKTGGYDYVRTPYQKSPIKREIALAIGYPDMRFGEDYDYSKRLKQSGLIKTEAYIPKNLYFYRYKFEESNKKYGIRA
jgi:glycosyltransferase involved in cell wall biosynthesis